MAKFPWYMKMGKDGYVKLHWAYVFWVSIKMFLRIIKSMKMSEVTNIMISACLTEAEENIVKKELQKVSPFGIIDDCIDPANRYPECAVFVAAVNHLDNDLFYEVIKGLESKISASSWEDLQVFIKGQYSRRWDVILASEITPHLSSDYK